MLLAIDVGNSHSVFGVWDGSHWLATWRHQTDVETTEDELAAWLFEMLRVRVWEASSEPPPGPNVANPLSPKTPESSSTEMEVDGEIDN